MARFIFVLLPLALGELVAYDFKGRGSTEAVSELLSRASGWLSRLFRSLSLLPKDI